MWNGSGTGGYDDDGHSLDQLRDLCYYNTDQCAYIYFKMYVNVSVDFSKTAREARLPLKFQQLNGQINTVDSLTKTF